MSRVVGQFAVSQIPHLDFLVLKFIHLIYKILHELSFIINVYEKELKKCY